jgi:DNA-binding transcriptional MerR regulator
LKRIDLAGLRKINLQRGLRVIKVYMTVGFELNKIKEYIAHQEKLDSEKEENRVKYKTQTAFFETAHSR